MEIAAEGVEVRGPHSPLLAPTSLRARDGCPLLVAGNPNSGRTALALTLAGRLRPTHGTVRLNGTHDPRALRRAVAIVDAADITEPNDAVPVRDVVAEGLSLAGRKSRRRAVRDWLAERGLSSYRQERFENLPARERTQVLTDLACASASTCALVFDCPDRHGDEPANWFALARQHAERGMAVIVLCAPHSAEQLAVPAARVGVDNRTSTQSTPESGEGSE